MERLRVLFLSDVHYRGPGEEGLRKLEEIVEKERPDLTVSAGDWDVGFDEEAFERLARMTYLLTIYGNHENRRAIEGARNADGRPVLLPDGEPVHFGSLIVAGISGNLGGGSKWHHKRPEEFESYARRLAGAGVDLMVTHEPPAGVPFYPGNPYGKRAVARAVGIVRPKVHLSGHVEYPTQCVKHESITFVHVDSQPPAFEYAVGVFEEGSLKEVKIRRNPTTPLGVGGLRAVWRS